MREPRTHDLSRRSWGNDYSISKADPPMVKMCIFRSVPIQVGDILLIPNAGAISTYRVLNVRRPVDPGDQYFITAEHAPQPVAKEPQ